MKRTWLPLSFALLGLIAAPAWAAPEAPAPAEPVPAATSLPASGACAGGTSASAFDPVAVSTGGVTAQAYCQADCDGLLISCWGGTCSAADRNCSTGQQGYIECDGVYTFCHQGPCTSCPCGTCGTLRWFQTEDCCPNNLHVMEERRCTTSGWVNTGNTDCLVECGGGGPL